MDRVYGAGEAVVAHLGDLADLRLGEASVGGHDPEGGALPPTQTGRCFREQLHRVAQRAVIQPRTCQHLTGLWVPDLAEGVYGGEGADDEAAREVYGGTPETTFHRAVHAQDFSYGRTCASSHAPLGEVAARGRRSRLVAHRRVGTYQRIPDNDIEEYGCRDQGYAGHAHVEAHALLFEEADDAVDGGEPEGAASGQEQGVRGTDGADRSQAVGLARTRG